VGAVSAVAQSERARLWRWALALAVFTVLYNVAEGLVSVLFGLQDETVALVGFGADSFVEVLSGLGILHMLWRLRRNGTAGLDAFEATALRVTAAAFFILAAALTVAAILGLYQGHVPQSTLWGMIVSVVSIATMWALLWGKLRVGRRLGSDALVADAHCTRACLWLSVVLLASSLGYALTGLGGLDSLGALGIAWLSLREGREALRKARGLGCACQGPCKV
jgi:divalent metal cation (Fe/Co/Zn/Cd) transporter